MPDTAKNASATTPKPAYRIFISSTFVDMIPYRNAIAEAIRNCDAIAYGMERFVPAPIRPLDRCYEEIESSQIFILLLGHRYGDIDTESGKSYTELEYLHAKELGLPILVFLLDTDKVGTPEKFRETDDKFQALRRFKEELKNSKEITVGAFESEKSLQEKATRSIADAKQRMEKAHQTSADPSTGPRLYKSFVKRPKRYKGQEAILRVRMEGRFGDTRLRDEVYTAFGMPIGDAIYMNGLFVQGTSVDVDYEGWLIDAFATGDAADWLDENKITTGTVFEGKFRFAYEIVKNGGSARGELPHDVYQAKLILLEGIRIIENGPAEGSAQRKKSLECSSDDNEYTGAGSAMQKFLTQLALKAVQTPLNDTLEGETH